MRVFCIDLNYHNMKYAKIKKSHKFEKYYFLYNNI